MSVRFLYANAKASPKLNTAFCNFAAQLIFSQPNDFGPCGTLGIFDDGKLIAAIIFHGWHPGYGVIEISAAASSPKWFSKRAVREIMAICFIQHNCQQIVSRMATNNERAIKIYKFLGFKALLLPNMRGAGKHEWLFMMTKDQWAKHRLNEVPK